jgi:hypothetical protein
MRPETVLWYSSPEQSIQVRMGLAVECHVRLLPGKSIQSKE